ncbi:MAG: SufD family Fe-S cluster assembly protein [Helicobacteraceae bacterium]|jgi:Fe-S cluster assembly protein SufD|nr:SufD family Fe-S cluster assembly protein [Helicobacteraceae bacterium]
MSAAPLQIRPAELPELFATDSRTKAMLARLNELGIPGNKTEQYKHFGIKPLLAKDYTRIDAQQGEPQISGKVLSICDGVVTGVPKGVAVSFSTDFQADMQHYDALYYLSHLLTPRCIVLTVEEDAAITVVHQLTQEESLTAYRLVVNVAPQVKASFYETFENEESSGSLLLYGLDVSVGRDAALTWVRNQSSSEMSAVVIGSHRYDVAAQGKLTLQTFDLGAGNALHLYKNDLAEQTEANVAHLLFGTGQAHLGNVVNLRHNGRSAKSVHEAKSILKDRATGIFDGLIRVGHDARYTTARQNAKAILLNDNAFMESKPQLEIYTDELEASHGSTTGELDEAALFYLRSRGISLEAARKILILSFVNEMIDAVEDNEEAEAIRAAFDTAYATKEIL